MDAVEKHENVVVCGVCKGASPVEAAPAIVVEVSEPAKADAEIEFLAEKAEETVAKSDDAEPAAHADAELETVAEDKAAKDEPEAAPVEAAKADDKLADAPVEAAKSEEPKPVVAPVGSAAPKLAAVSSVATATLPKPMAKHVARLRTFAETYGFKAAGVFVAVGAGWIIGANSFDNHAETRKLIDAMNGFSVKLADVEQVAKQAQGAGNVQKTLAGLKSAVETSRANGQAAIAQVNGKIEKLDRDHAARMDRANGELAKTVELLGQRLDKLEKRAADVTASIPPVPPPSPAAPAQVAQRPQAADSHALPVPPETTRIERARIPADGYVLRRVYDGVALLEGRRGLVEVEPGDVLPGAGRVRAIEKRGRQWVVVTSTGEIDTQTY